MTRESVDLIDLNEKILGVWQQLDLENHECHYRRAFGELLLNCAHVISVMNLFEGRERDYEDLKYAILQCVTPSDILKMKIDDLESRIKQVES